MAHFLSVSVRCLQPEGLYKDPTDITHYIHCHKGKPHTMVCPDEMTWDDSKKSCFGAGTFKTLALKFQFIYLPLEERILELACLRENGEESVRQSLSYSNMLSCFQKRSYKRYSHNACRIVVVSFFTV